MTMYDRRRKLFSGRTDSPTPVEFIRPVKTTYFQIEESQFTGDPEKDCAVITGDKAYSNEAVLAFIEYESGLSGWGITPGWQGLGGCYRRADGLYEWKVDRTG